MDRKWRFNKAGYETVLSVNDFKDRIPPVTDGENTLVTPTDLYAMYTWLHIERKEWELVWSTEGKFYYFLVTWQDIVKEIKKPEEIAQKTQGGEDDEDMVEGAVEDEEDYQEYSAADSEGASEDDDAEGGAAANTANQQQQTQEGGDKPTTTSSAKPIKWYTRTQIVIPVSSSTQGLTPMLLQRFFSVRGVSAQQLILALIDSNGVPTQNVLYNYIQSPLEGPGMANLELLDD